MHKIAILTDSTCDLSQELLDKYNIHYFPLYVTINNETYKDGAELKAKEMYEKAEAIKAHPKTAAASIQDIYDFFMKFLKEDKEIVYAGIGGGLSCTFQNTHIVRDLVYDKHPEYEGRIHLVDSMNLSTGISLTLIKMCEARDQGKTAKEIVEIGEDVVPRVRAQFCVENLDYIHKGGRCSNSAKFFGTLLSIKPMLKVQAGKLNVWKKSIGSFKKALNIMIDEFLTNFENIDKSVVFITHSEGDPYAKYIEEKISGVIDRIENVYNTKAGCVISSHCGRNTTGILYVMNK